jgi:hypothetical protein
MHVLVCTTNSLLHVKNHTVYTLCPFEQDQH